MENIQIVDSRLKTPLKCQIIGASGTGKTRLLLDILRYAEYVFDDPSYCEYVFVYHRIWPTIFDSYPDVIKKERCFQRIPTECELEVIGTRYKGKCTIILDDIADQLTKEHVALFTVFSRHCGMNVFVLSQELFISTPLWRIISHNSNHVCLFKMMRNVDQIEYFARQIVGRRKGSALAKLIDEEIEKPYGYIWFDLDPSTSKDLRIRTGVRPSDYPMIAWIIEEE